MVFSFQLPPPLLPLEVPFNPTLDSEEDTEFPSFSPPPRLWPSSHFIAANANWEIRTTVIKLQTRKQICDFSNKKNCISEESAGFSPEMLCG